MNSGGYEPAIGPLHVQIMSHSTANEQASTVAGSFRLRGLHTEAMIHSMGNRGNVRGLGLWFVLAGVVALLAALIVAITLDVTISTRTSVVILVACGAVSAALIMSNTYLSPDDRDGARPGQRGTPDPGNVSNWLFLADSHADRGEAGAAEQLYRRAAEAGHTGAMSRLAALLAEQGRTEEAERYRRMAAATEG